MAAPVTDALSATEREDFDNLSANPITAPSETAPVRRPTNRQWWKVAQLALELLELPAPQSRREMSELIDRLQSTVPAASTSDGAPF